MKVCIISYSHYDIDHRVSRYAEALIEKGACVDVIALRRNDQPKKFIHNGVTVYGIQKRIYDETCILDYVMRTGSFFIKGGFLLTLKCFPSKYHIIHIHNVPDFLIFMGAIPKILGSKLILDIHDILPEFFCQKFGKKIDSILAKFLLMVEKLSIRFAHHVIVANDIWREKIILRNKLKQSKCTTLLNYPSELSPNIKLKQTKDSLNLIYPGTISHLHGVDILLNALYIVKKTIPNVNLKIYTRANNLEYFNSLQTLIDKLDIRENVHFYDPVSRNELWQIYSQVDMGIVCKRDGIFASEAFSTKMIEFMAVGLPIVASRTKIDEYYFNDSMVTFFKPGDHEDLAKSIINLHQNPEKQKTMTASGKAFVQKNTWEIKKQIYLDIVDKLVNKK